MSTTSEQDIRDLAQSAAAAAQELSAIRGALERTRLPGPVRRWIARFPVNQLGNEEAVRQADDLLGDARAAVFRFIEQCSRLPEQTLIRIRDAGVPMERLRAIATDDLPTSAHARERGRILGVLREALAHLERAKAILAGLGPETYRQS